MRKDDLVGMVFNGWTVMSRSHKRSSWECVCECGVKKSVYGPDLKSGHSKSCGCKRNDLISAKNKTHGLTGTPEYITWASIIARCTNKKNNRYSIYGGRGIKICSKWRQDFEAFLSDVGKKPSPLHSIDRIDVNGNYEPQNVRWATTEEQSRNKRNTVQVVYKGKKMSLSEFAQHIGMNFQRVNQRWQRGWSTERIAATKLELPSRKLNAYQIQTILASSASQSTLALQFGVSKSLIGKIRKGIDGYKTLHQREEL